MSPWQSGAIAALTTASGFVVIVRMYEAYLVEGRPRRESTWHRRTSVEQRSEVAVRANVQYHR